MVIVGQPTQASKITIKGNGNAYGLHKNVEKTTGFHAISQSQH